MAEDQRFRGEPESANCSGKLNSVLNAYKAYHDNHEIDEMKNVYMDKSEVLRAIHKVACE